MRAMVLAAQREPLELRDIPRPDPGPGQLLLRVAACAVCRTDLHVVDGDLPDPKLPLVPGHEVVGRVAAVGEGVADWTVGMRAGVPWLGSTCGVCSYCRSGRENLCSEARFTGYQIDGGYAEWLVADASFCLQLPEGQSEPAIAPLLCAGLIGYRSLKACGDAGRLGLFGFGAAAHIVAQIATSQGRRVFAFTRPGDRESQDFAMELGAEWAGGTDRSPPEELDGAIIFAPVGELVPLALKAVVRGGRVICAGIHMSDIPSFPYEILWGERRIESVANLTRRDGAEFMSLLKRIPIRTTVTEYPLERANEALDDLRAGRLQGAAVLVLGAGAGSSPNGG